jgi:hypothetical protein
MTPKENNGALADPLIAIPFAAAITGTSVEGPLKLTINSVGWNEEKQDSVRQNEALGHGGSVEALNYMDFFLGK